MPAETTTPPAPVGYDYRRLIRPETTNEKLLSIIMNHSRAGLLIQAFVLEGLRIYSEQVIEGQDKLREQMGERSFINPDAWIACAEDVKSALKTQSEKHNHVPS